MQEPETSSTRSRENGAPAKEEHAFDEKNNKGEGLKNSLDAPPSYRGIPAITLKSLDSTPLEPDQPPASAPRKDLPGILAFLPLKNKVFQASLVAGVFVVGLLCCGALSFYYGRHIGRKAASRDIRAPSRNNSPLPEFPEAALPEFDSALLLLRKGEKSDALKALEHLLKSYPDAPSLHYATAFAAMQAGYPREANIIPRAPIQSARGSC
jgi:hypothetical protein